VTSVSTAAGYKPVLTPEVVTHLQPGACTNPARARVIATTETAVYPRPPS